MFYILFYNLFSLSTTVIIGKENLLIKDYYGAFRPNLHVDCCVDTDMDQMMFMFISFKFTA